MITETRVAAPGTIRTHAEELLAHARQHTLSDRQRGILRGTPREGCEECTARRNTLVSDLHMSPSDHARSDD